MRKADEKPNEESAEPVETQSAAEEGIQPRPKKRRKRKYSKDLRGVQKFERNASKALLRVTRSVDAGISEWRKQTDRSARRRKDGALRDAPENLAKAVGKQLRVASRAPEDLVRAVRSLRIRKVVRRLIPIP